MTCVSDLSAAQYMCTGSTRLKLVMHECDAQTTPVTLVTVSGATLRLQRCVEPQEYICVRGQNEPVCPSRRIYTYVTIDYIGVYSAAWTHRLI